MRCTFSKPGPNGTRIYCHKPAERNYKGTDRFPCRFPLCAKHYEKWTKHPKAGYGLGVKVFGKKGEEGNMGITNVA